MKKYTFEYEKIHDVGKGLFDVHAETREGAEEIAKMLSPNAKLVGEGDSNRETSQNDTKTDLF
jgi:hypothetical protein